MKKSESIYRRIVKGWGYIIVATVMNTWFCTVMISVAGNSLILKLVVGIAALVILNGLLFNYSYNAAKSDREQIKYHKQEKDDLMPLKMSIFVPLYHYICLIWLCMCKAGIIRFENVKYAFNYYSLLNIHTLPWTGMFTNMLAEGRTLESLTVPGILGLWLITLIEPAVISLTYIITLKDIDVKESLMYNKKG